MGDAFYELKQERYDDYQLRLRIYRQSLRDLLKDVERV